MAFGDSNDIKINVTLDTEGAIKAANELKSVLESSLTVAEKQFQKLDQISKAYVTNLSKGTQEQITVTKQTYDQIVESANDAATKRIAADQRAANERARIALRERDVAVRENALRLRDAENTARREIEIEKTKRTEILAQLSKFKKEKTPTAELPVGTEVLAEAQGSGKLLKELKGLTVSLGNRFGLLSGSVSQFLKVLSALGPAGQATAAGVVGLGALGVAISKLNTQIDEVSQQAGKLEGLKTGFETLQRSIGQNPEQSIQKLREATQGLVSDVDLYQRANQAVLLGVPTDTFNEAAAAAVKLGRAMGIDASAGLESLSLGLGRQSRLYLDNLGIIVSAEEAYQKFAATVNKNATDLTDAEKKAAFFAEALAKIKERADQLPDPIDSVATAQQKANVAQENANKLFLEGFNANKALTAQYLRQQEITKQASEVAFVFGGTLAELGAIARGAANDLSQFALTALVPLAQYFNQIFKFTPEAKIQATKDEIKRLEDQIADLQDRSARGIGNPYLNTRFIEESTAALEAQRKELERLETKANQLNGTTIAIKVLIANLQESQNAIANLFTNLQTQAEQELGIFKVEGLTDDQAANAFKRLTDAKVKFDLSVKDTTALNKYKEEVGKIQKEIIATPFENATKNIASAGSQLAQSIGSLDFSKAKDALNDVKGGVSEVTKVIKGQGVSQAQFTKLIEGSAKAADKFTSKYTKNLKTAGKELDKQEKELKQFTQGIARALDNAIPEDFQKKLVDIFNDPTLSAEQLADKIQALGIDFKNAGGDVGAFIKEAAALKDLKDEVPGRDLVGSSEITKDFDKVQEEIKKAQEGVLNIKNLFGGDGSKGAFFGFDLGGGISTEAQGQLAGVLQDQIGNALQIAADGVSREDAPNIGRAIGAVVGAAIAAALQVDPAIGAAIGGVIGEVAGTAVMRLGKDTPGTRQRKAIDSYFADLFDGDRLAVVIKEQLYTYELQARNQIAVVIDNLAPEFQKIDDLVFGGLSPVGGEAPFGGENFFNFFNTLGAEAQNTLTGIGIAFGKLNGIASEQARLIGVAFANNLGGSLQNLQILIQTTGESLEDLSTAVIQAFLDASLGIDEAYNSLLQLQGIFEVGIPGAIGAVDQAIGNFLDTINVPNPGRYLIDSLRDIGAEGEEAGRSFQSVISQLGESLGFGANQIQLLFLAFRSAGINSLQDLKTASDALLISILKRVKDVQQGISDTQDDITATPIIPEPDKKDRPSGPKKKTAAEIAREEAAKLLAQQRKEAFDLAKNSAEYAAILDKIVNKQLSILDGGKQIASIQRELLGLVIRRDKLEEALAEEFNKGAKANKKAIADLAAALRDTENKLKKATEAAANNGRVYKDLDLKAIRPLIKTQNDLGVIARQVGIDLQKNVDILVKGFIQGRLSIKEVNDEINKTKELLGPGIPNAVGAVDDAFKNLIAAGERGGQFSLDAFTDVFAEFREKFNKEGSALRKAQGDQLRANLDAAREAYAAAVGPDATEAAKKSLDLAAKALNDFYAKIPAPDLADLRTQLESSFGKDQVALFFQAIDESGLSTFEDFEKAGSEAIISILGRLEELGFEFAKTSEDTGKINQGLQDAETAANAGLDPLAEAINLVKQFNQGASALPPVFDSTTAAISNLNQPLSKLAKGFDDIIEKLGKLSGQTFENDVVFNVRTIGDSGGKALVDLIFGDGSDIGSGTGGTGQAKENKEAAKRAKIRLEMKVLEKAGLKTAQQKNKYNQLKKQLAALGG